MKHIKSKHLSELERLKVSAYRVWVDTNRPLNNDDVCFLNYKKTKKNFAKAIKAALKVYENDQILEVIRSAELDRNKFWKNIASAIKRQDGKVVHEIVDVLNVWKGHYENLGVPKQSPYFDDVHFHRVMSFVENYKKSDSSESKFLDNSFS